MDALPKELLYVLIFIGIALFQYLVKRFGQLAKSETAAAEPAPEPPEEAEPPQWSLPGPTATHFGRSPAPATARRTVPDARRTPRFSRKSLLGSRRDVQNAMVLATILGPCRAMEPLGGGEPTTGPRQPSR